MKFRSRVSVVMPILAIALLAVPMVLNTGSGQYIEVIVEAVLVLFILATFLSLRYTIDGDKLYISEYGFRIHTYDINKLVSITPTRTLLSAPAASLKRIKLDFGCGSPLVISPAGQEEFIAGILRVNPSVKINL